jgi:hypothetical protein
VEQYSTASDILKWCSKTPQEKDAEMVAWINQELETFE